MTGLRDPWADTPCMLTEHETHSDDMLTVWHGVDRPLRICGYHYSRADTRVEGFKRNHELVNQ